MKVKVMYDGGGVVLEGEEAELFDILFDVNKSYVAIPIREGHTRKVPRENIKFIDFIEGDEKDGGKRSE